MHLTVEVYVHGMIVTIGSSQSFVMKITVFEDVKN